MAGDARLFLRIANTHLPDLWRYKTHCGSLTGSPETPRIAQEMQ